MKGRSRLGAVQAGIDIALAVESNPHAAKAYAKNHKGTTVFCDDIRAIDLSKLKQGVAAHQDLGVCAVERFWVIVTTA